MDRKTPAIYRRVKTRRAAILLPLLLLTPATMTLAQDSPPTPVAKKKAPAASGKTVWKRSSQRVRVKTIKGQLGDIEAKRFADDAERVRKRAACMLAAADEMDKAAKRLDKAAEKDRDRAFDQADEAAALVDECDNEPLDEVSDGEPPEGKTQISGATASKNCAADQTGCNKSFGNQTLSKLINDRQDDFRACYEDGLARRADLKGVTRFMMRVGAGDRAGEIEKLRIEQDTVDDMEMLECQADVVDQLDLPEEADGKTLRFTVRHTPRPAKKN